MTNEQLTIVQRVLDGTFSGVVAVLEEDCIAVQNWGILPYEPQGFLLAFDSSDGDVVEVLKSSFFSEVVIALASEIAQDKAEAVLDTLATEAQVADWESQNS